MFQRFFHKRLKIGGHKWLPTVHQSICDPLDGGREISYRAMRKCALCGCVDKDWRVVDGSETRIDRPSAQVVETDWRLGLVGLALKPFAIVALIALLLINGVSISVGGLRSLFGTV